MGTGGNGLDSRRYCYRRLGDHSGDRQADRSVHKCGSRDTALCFAYILGVSDAMQAAQASGGTLVFGGERVCYPAPWLKQ
jgi:hypothetical protein